MNRGLNLPQIQRIMGDFEKESAMMDMKEDMMSEAVDDVMDDDMVDEEEEGDKILKEVLDEIGVGLQQQVSMSLAATGLGIWKPTLSTSLGRPQMQSGPQVRPLQIGNRLSRWAKEAEEREKPTKNEMREMYKELGGRKAKAKGKFGGGGAARDKGGWEAGFGDE